MVIDSATVLEVLRQSKSQLWPTIITRVTTLLDGFNSPCPPREADPWTAIYFNRCWVHSFNVPHGEDVIYQFKEAGYTLNTLHKFISSYIDELRALLGVPDPIVWSVIPVAQYLLEKQIHVDGTGAYGIKYCGDLTVNERASITHRFFNHVPGATLNRLSPGNHRVCSKWLGGASLVHAYSQELLKDGITLTSLDAREALVRLQLAWVDIIEKTGTKKEPVDVGRECLMALEERLFEGSTDAGDAGNRKWGLDAGHHQGKWDPYEGIPSSWVKDDRSRAQRKRVLARQHGPDFSEGGEQDQEYQNVTIVLQKRIRPRTRVIRNVKKKD